MSHEPPRAPGGSEHLELDQLADLDEDLLTPADTTAAEEHLAGCGECRRRRADLRTTRALLSTLPADPMPAAVATRIDAALAALPSATIVPLAGRRRSRWRAHPTMAGLGAAATVAALVGALVVARAESHHSSSDGGGTAASGATSRQAPLPLPAALATGTKYTAHNLGTTVPGLLHPQQALLAPASPGPQTAAGTAKSSASAVPAALTRLFGSTAALDACVRSVETGGALVKPLAIDFATYEGAPSLLIVLPGLDTGTIDAWFVGPGCDATNENLVTYKSVPTASPSPAG